MADENILEEFTHRERLYWPSIVRIYANDKLYAQLITDFHRNLSHKHKFYLDLMSVFAFVMCAVGNALTPRESRLFHVKSALKYV